MKGAPRLACLLASLMRGPKTMAEIGADIGLVKRTEHRLRLQLDALYDMGVIYIPSWASAVSPRYALQPGEPFVLPDAPKPETAAQIGARLGLAENTIHVRRGKLKRTAQVGAS